jgi:hypothetical protein
LHAGIAVNGRTIEAHAIFEGIFQFGWADSETLESSENIGEPETY